MNSEYEFGEQLRGELRAAGVFPDREAYARDCSRITRVGELERALVARTVGRRWDDLLESLALKQAEDVCALALGGGRTLTEFLVSPLGLPDDLQTEVASLGALANFLVTTYDRLLDSDRDPDEVLAPLTLTLAMTGQSPRLRAVAVQSSPVQRAFIRLVRDYFTRIERLPHARSRPEVRRAVDHHIQTMYAAERETVSGTVTGEVLRIKSSYPLVVMGLPGWLATDRLTADRYDRHVAWLEDVGEFLGLIDDAIDLQEDAAVGLTNRVAMKRSEQGDTRTVTEIVETGRAVFCDWEVLTEGDDPDQDLDSVVRTCVASWFGGPVEPPYL